MFRSYLLEFDGWSQLQISIDNSRIVQTEHHWIEDSFIYENKHSSSKSIFRELSYIKKGTNPVNVSINVKSYLGRYAGGSY